MLQRLLLIFRKLDTFQSGSIFLMSFLKYLQRISTRPSTGFSLATPSWFNEIVAMPSNASKIHEQKGDIFVVSIVISFLRSMKRAWESYQTSSSNISETPSFD